MIKGQEYVLLFLKCVSYQNACVQYPASAHKFEMGQLVGFLPPTQETGIEFTVLGFCLCHALAVASI